MRNLVCVLGAVLVLGAAAWDMGEPVTAYWAGPGFPGGPALSETWLKQLKDGGFNVVWAQSVADLDLAARFGMRAIYKPAALHEPPEGEKELVAYKQALDAAVDRVKNHPALYVYELCDEPSAGKFARLARAKERINRRDPKHAVWVNLLPTYANNQQLGVEGEIISAYWEHVRLFGEVYRPDFLTYDHYQFSVGGDGNGYLRNLAIIRQRASSLGVPFFNGVQACTWQPGNLASPSAPRIPTVDELRYLVYTTAAYGAQGIYYYVYCYPGHAGSIVSLEGKPSDKYEALKTLNREFIALARELRPYRFTGAYLQGVLPPGATPFCGQELLKVSPAVPTVAHKPGQALDNTTMVTRFDASGRPTCLMVVNMDYRVGRKLRVEAPTAASRFDPAKGTWTQLAGRTFTLDLPRGGGALLRLK